MSNKEQENISAEEQIVTEKQIPIKLVFPDELQSHFVNHFVAQFRGDYFILSAFQIWPPIILGNEEERRAAVESLNLLEAQCVSRLVLTPSEMRDLVDILEINLAKHQEYIDSTTISESQS